MRSQKPWKALLGVSLLAASVLTTGCGDLTIRTWVKVIEDQSAGNIHFLDQDFPLERVQGGFYGNVRVSTRNLLEPLEGTIVLEDVRIAADNPTLAGTVCTWGNPALPSGGTVELDVLGGGGSAELTINLLATTTLNQTFNLPPLALAQDVVFELGTGLGIDQFLAAALDGSPDGLFATSAAFVGDAEILGFPAQFQLDLEVTNEGSPPLFDADLLAFCGPYFEEQGRDLFWNVNSKGSYLLADQNDDPQAPLVIALADVGAGPGDVLKLGRVGTFSPTTELKDGTLTGLTAAFSGSSQLRGDGERNRIVNAIDAGANVTTGKVLSCWFIFCSFKSTDIPEDFRVDPSVNVTVPAGATHLFVAPLPKVLLYKDNSGFGFGVSVEVNP
jgi:hypothetical protein